MKIVKGWRARYDGQEEERWKEKRFMEAEWRSKPLTKMERKEKRKTQGTQGTEEEAEDYAKRASILAH